MIIDLNLFIKEERGYWSELEGVLDILERKPEYRMDLTQARRFYYLYQRTSADLAKIMTFSAELELRRYLESLVGKAFSEIHETRKKPHRLALTRWFFHTFPRTFRRHIFAFWICLIVMLLGFALGGLAISLDLSAKEFLVPFPHLQTDPSKRVADEESVDRDRLKNQKYSFSSYLITHNIRVSIFALALGMTWGIGTVILLFSNGAMLGVIALDYIFAGQGTFLLAWLMPHGSIEIPAILIAAQAGLILANALIGWGRPVLLRERLRRISGDVVTLVFGVSIMLVWAGIVEAFLSQYHEPIIGYEYKIVLGIIELTLLVLFLSKSGTTRP
ncbi:MAG: stage II sporulation protein M [Thermodesulfobacteriota bacterium]|nr:stage II sporulation protein M [Thermodesulfobacteriota bacterium]